MSPLVLGLIILVLLAAVAVVIKKRRRRKVSPHIGKEAKRFLKALLQKEQIKGFLVNLEKLKSEGNVSTDQYDVMKKDYDESLRAVSSEVEDLKAQVSRQLEEAKRSLDANTWELGKLETRFKVGEFSVENYQKLEHKIRRRIEKLESRIAELGNLTEAESSADIPGFEAMSADSRRIKGGAPKRLKTEALQMEAFTEFIDSRDDVISPRTKLLCLVGGFLLIISVYLTWVSTKPIFGMSLTFSGSDISGALVASGLICGLISIAAILLARPQGRGLIHISMGAIAIIVLLAMWFSEPSSSEMGEMGMAIQEAVKEMITIREGLYLFALSAVALVIGGLMELREK